MRSILIEFVPSGEGLEDITASADGFERDEILEAIAHALIQLRLRMNDRPELTLVRGQTDVDGRKP